MFSTFMLVVVGLIVATIGFGVKIVPQGAEYVVERLGRFHVILKPGFNIVIPFVDVVAYKMTTKDQALEIPQQEAITQDNAVIICNAIAFVKVVDPQKAAYGITNFHYAVTNLVMTNLRAIIGSMTLNEALSQRDTIKTRLKAHISDDVADWGIVVKAVEIQDVRPSDTMQQAMEKQAGAARLKEAAILEAEGKKEAAIREAEGKLEAARKEAEAQIALAGASAEAIREISAAIGTNETSAYFLLGDRYITNLQKLAASSNAKVFVLPADILGAVKGLIGKSA